MNVFMKESSICQLVFAEVLGSRQVYITSDVPSPVGIQLIRMTGQHTRKRPRRQALRN